MICSRDINYAAVEISPCVLVLSSHLLFLDSFSPKGNKYFILLWHMARLTLHDTSSWHMNQTLLHKFITWSGCFHIRKMFWCDEYWMQIPRTNSTSDERYSIFWKPRSVQLGTSPCLNEGQMQVLFHQSTSVGPLGSCESSPLIPYGIVVSLRKAIAMANKAWGGGFLGTDCVDGI